MWKAGRHRTFQKGTAAANSGDKKSRPVCWGKKEEEAREVGGDQIMPGFGGLFQELGLYPG